MNIHYVNKQYASLHVLLIIFVITVPERRTRNMRINMQHAVIVWHARFAGGGMGKGGYRHSKDGKMGAKCHARGTMC